MYLNKQHFPYSDTYDILIGLKHRKDLSLRRNAKYLAEEKMIPPGGCLKAAFRGRHYLIMTSHGINYDLKKVSILAPIFSMEKTSFLLENVAISMHSFTKGEDALEISSKNV